MFKSNRAIWAAVLCVALGAAGCGDDDPAPTAPTPMPDPEPEPAMVMISGAWHGEFEGTLVSGEAHVNLEQTGMNVTGDWRTPMPAALVAFGAPSDVELAGPVTGTVEGSTADLEFAFLEAFHIYFGGPDCVLDVQVTEFTEDDLEATWETTDDTCPVAAGVDDMGTLDMHKD